MRWIFWRTFIGNVDSTVPAIAFVRTKSASDCCFPTSNPSQLPQIIDIASECDRMAKQYEKLTSDLLKWIKETIDKLSEREFANSLEGVQRQLAEFNSYRTVEKPPKYVFFVEKMQRKWQNNNLPLRFAEKGDLEMRLFAIQSKQRAHDLRPYNPKEGKKIQDINKAWENLEKAEHERELALREELIRQERIEMLAQKFDRKCGMRENWISENQRLVSQDHFGTDLSSVEASAKKHEAIETDIYAYEDRVAAVVIRASDLEMENYHDIDRVNARKENVLRLWNYLLDLLRGRRSRLERTLAMYQTFEEMIQVLDQMNALKAQLETDEFGRHLMDVEELLQKHALLENDIAILGDRTRTVNTTAQGFVDEGIDEPQVMKERIEHMEASIAELMDLSVERRHRLEDSRRLWQFFWDMAEEEAWIKEKEHILSSVDIGKDLTSINLLLSKHRVSCGDWGGDGRGIVGVNATGDCGIGGNSMFCWFSKRSRKS